MSPVRGGRALGLSGRQRAALRAGRGSGSLLCALERPRSPAGPGAPQPLEPLIPRCPQPPEPGRSRSPSGPSAPGPLKPRSPSSPGAAGAGAAGRGRPVWLRCGPRPPGGAAEAAFPVRPRGAAMAERDGPGGTGRAAGGGKMSLHRYGTAAPAAARAPGAPSPGLGGRPWALQPARCSRAGEARPGGAGQSIAGAGTGSGHGGSLQGGEGNPCSE